MTELVKIRAEHGICTVRLDRPARKNALTAAMYEAMSDTLCAAEKDPEIRALVFLGAEGVFCAGNDLQDFLASEDSGRARPARALLHALAASTLPLVAAVDGVAIGVGATLLLHCDFVLATPAASFSLPFVNLGVCPEAGSSLLLPRLAGHQRAAALLMLGEPFDADAAQAMGLVTAVCPPADLEARAMETARKLAAKPRAALRATKALLKRPEEPLAARIEAEIERFDALLEAPAAREIMAAFIEKRAPDRRAID